MPRVLLDDPVEREREVDGERFGRTERVVDVGFEAEGRMERLGVLDGDDMRLGAVIRVDAREDEVGPRRRVVGCGATVLGLLVGRTVRVVEEGEGVVTRCGTEGALTERVDDGMRDVRDDVFGFAVDGRMDRVAVGWVVTTRGREAGCVDTARPEGLGVRVVRVVEVDLDVDVAVDCRVARVGVVRVGVLTVREALRGVILLVAVRCRVLDVRGAGSLLMARVPVERDVVDRVCPAIRAGSGVDAVTVRVRAERFVGW